MILLSSMRRCAGLELIRMRNLRKEMNSVTFKPIRTEDFFSFLRMSVTFILSSWRSLSRNVVSLRRSEMPGSSFAYYSYLLQISSVHAIFRGDTSRLSCFVLILLLLLLPVSNARIAALLP